MRGRKPKTTAQQIAEGDPRKKGMGKLKEQLACEPTTTRGLPNCPRHLAGVVRRAWKFWREELQVMNQDHRPDAMMLEGACVNYARAIQADEVVSREGLTVDEFYVDEEGQKILIKTKAHPAVSISNQAWRQVRSFCSEFGLSPVSRTRLKIEKKDAEGMDLARLLSAPREKKEPVVH